MSLAARPQASAGDSFLVMRAPQRNVTAGSAAPTATSPATADGGAEAAVHGFSGGYWWAAGVYVVAAAIYGLLIPPKTYAYHHTRAELGDEAILMTG